MGWVDEVEAASQTDTRGPRCQTCVWLDGLSDDERDDVNDALARPIERVKHTVLYEKIMDRWPDCGLSSDSMVNHRRGKCRGTR